MHVTRHERLRRRRRWITSAISSTYEMRWTRCFVQSTGDWYILHDCLDLWLPTNMYEYVTITSMYFVRPLAAKAHASDPGRYGRFRKASNSASCTRICILQQLVGGGSIFRRQVTVAKPRLVISRDFGTISTRRDIGLPTSLGREHVLYVHRKAISKETGQETRDEYSN